MTMTELFESMPGKLNAAAAGSLKKTFQWNITGDESGVWALQVADGAGRLDPWWS